MRTEAEKIEIAKRICEAYAADGAASIEYICSNVGISHTAFYSWLSESSELAAALVLARQKHGEAKYRREVERIERERELAHAATEVLLKGGQEETEEQFWERTGEVGADGKPIFRTTRIKKTVKTLRPCPVTVKHTLEKTDPKFKDELNINLGGRVELDLGSKTDAELDEIEKDLDNQLPEHLRGPGIGAEGGQGSPDHGEEEVTGGEGQEARDARETSSVHP